VVKFVSFIAIPFGLTAVDFPFVLLYYQNDFRFASLSGAVKKGWCDYHPFGAGFFDSH